jgi:hypothetical protein
MGFLSKIFGGSGRQKTELFTAPLPPSQTAVAEAEEALKLTFPASFTEFLSTTRQMHLPLCARFYWVGTAGSDGLEDIVHANRVEHKDASSALPDFLVAFYNDGMGNQVCFDTRTRSEGGEYRVVFWDHELDSQENLQASTRPAGGFERAGIVAPSFSEWLRKLHERIA